ncbi:MAG: hypothetical protein EBU52_17100 [Cytophagia bacterium]|nr:hypothetical protein [Cytophagia bacterium]
MKLFSETLRWKKTRLVTALLSVAVIFKVSGEKPLSKVFAKEGSYTIDGKVPTESSDKTTFIVGISIANVQTVDKKLTAITRIKRMPYNDLKVDENKINEIEIDGIYGYEIVGEGLDKANGTKELIYQVMLFTDNGYYIIVGTAKTDFQQNLELFKKVARTLKRK